MSNTEQMDYRTFSSGKKTLLAAPAGYGKTYTIVQCLSHSSEKQLVLTHTHAGVASIKEKIRLAGLPTNTCTVETISSFAQRYATAYSVGSMIPNQDAKDYHSVIAERATSLFRSPLLQNVVRATHCGLFVDEYQDCTKLQHEMIMASM